MSAERDPLIPPPPTSHRGTDEHAPATRNELRELRGIVDDLTIDVRTLKELIGSEPSELTGKPGTGLIAALHKVHTAQNEAKAAAERYSVARAPVKASAWHIGVMLVGAALLAIGSFTAAWFARHWH